MTKSYGVIMWDNEHGRCSTVSLKDIHKHDVDDKLEIGKKYQVNYGRDVFWGILKMIGM
jgi:hypothetical protein